MIYAVAEAAGLQSSAKFAVKTDAVKALLGCICAFCAVFAIIGSKDKAILAVPIPKTKRKQSSEQ